LGFAQTDAAQITEISDSSNGDVTLIVPAHEG